MKRSRGVMETHNLAKVGMRVRFPPVACETIIEAFIRAQLETDAGALNEGDKLPAALALSLALASAEMAREKMSGELPFRAPSAMTEPGTTGDEAQTTSTSTAAKKKREKLSRKELEALVLAAAKKHNVPAAFIDAIIRTESNYNPKAVSHAGAQGIMQIMPATAKGLDLEDPFDPGLAIDAGTRHLKWLLDKFNDDYVLAAAAYNAGRANVLKHGGVPPFKETQKYVKVVIPRMKASKMAND